MKVCHYLPTPPPMTSESQENKAFLELHSKKTENGCVQMILIKTVFTPLMQSRAHAPTLDGVSVLLLAQQAFSFKKKKERKKSRV